MHGDQTIVCIPMRTINNVDFQNKVSVSNLVRELYGDTLEVR